MDFIVTNIENKSKIEKYVFSYLIFLTPQGNTDFLFDFFKIRIQLNIFNPPLFKPAMVQNIILFITQI